MKLRMDPPIHKRRSDLRAALGMAASVLSNDADDDTLDEHLIFPYPNG